MNFVPATKKEEVNFSVVNPLNTTFKTQVESTLGWDVVLKVSERASESVPKHLRNIGVVTAFEDAAGAALVGQIRPPASLLTLVGDPGTANQIQGCLVRAGQASTVAFRGQHIKQAIDLFSRSVGCEAARQDFGRRFGDRFIRDEMARPPWDAEVVRAVARAPHGEGPRLCPWLRHQGNESAMKEFSRTLEQELTTQLSQKLSIDMFNVDTRRADWFRSVPLDELFEHACSISGRGEVNAKMPTSMPLPVVTQRAALRNQVITAGTLGALGIGCELLGVGASSWGPVLAKGLAVVAVVASWSQSSQALGGSYSVNRLCDDWKNSPQGNTCGGTLRGLVVAFKSICGDGTKVSKAEESVLKEIYNAIKKVEEIREGTAGVDASGKKSSDARLSAEDWDVLAKKIVESTGSVPALPQMVVEYGLPVAVSLPLWRPIVSAWLGW